MNTFGHISPQAISETGGRRRARWKLVVLTALIGLAGCDGGGDAADDKKDTSEAPIWAAVGGAQDDGTGFVDWSDGTVKPRMIRGPQGGQHIWVTVRMTGLSPKQLKMTVEMRRQDNGKIVKPGAVPIIASLAKSKTKPDVYEFGRLTAFVKCPCQIAGAPVRVNLKLDDIYGRTFSTSAHIRPQWSEDCSEPPSTSCAEQ